jgi:hypothetical protein
MANRTVHLSKLIQTPKGPRYCPAVMAANGRVRPDVVIVSGEAERLFMTPMSGLQPSLS